MTTLVKDYNRQCVQQASIEIKMTDLVHNVQSGVVLDLPPNAVILSGQLVTTEAWNSTTSDVLDVGDTASAVRYLTDGNIRALNALVALVPTGFITPSVAGGLRVTWTSGGGTPTTGKVRLQVTYFTLGKADSTYGP